MAESVKRRLNATKIGKMSDYELRKLIEAALADMRAIAADLAKVQIVMNNVGSAVSNIKTNCSNATVNYNAQTLTAVSNAALNLTD